MIKTFFVALLTISLLACSQFPVQELSDARQALEAARDVGAEQHAQDDYITARHLLEEAETEVDAGEYSDAENTALRAKRFALRARLRTVTGH